MEHPQFQTSLAKSMWDTSVALGDLRDALVELSLELQDWQFEADLEQRRIAEDACHRLLENIAATRGFSS